MNVPATNLPPSVDLRALIELFYEQPDDLGGFSEQSAENLPANYCTLLAHHKHMTVTVEAFHDSPVDVVVHRINEQESLYAREITLTRQRDGHVVQYGIVRLNHQYFEPDVWSEIVDQQIPLGRVLIQHNVLREVVLGKLWRIQTGPPLAEKLNIPSGAVTYGRTAMIYCNKEPAIELLEIVTI